jgi:hypothetical protein
VRWATDLGPDDYDLPGYFGELRWSYYRLRTESHNTVLIDGENQDPQARAPLRFDHRRVRVDLSKAYPAPFRRHIRELWLDRGYRVVVRDKIEASEPIEVLWGMITDATVEVAERQAVLRKSGKRLVARLRSPEGATFATIPAQPAPPQKPNAGATKLAVKLAARVMRTRIEVTLALESTPSH